METCKECGYIHPPVAGGCPVAKNKNRTESEKGRIITEVIGKLTDYLHSSEKWKTELNTLRGMFKL